MQGLIARKVGMTRIFNAAGEQVPATVLECGPCVVLQRKRAGGPDGYEAVQLGFCEVPERKLTRPLAEAARKNSLPFCRYRREFRIEAGEDLKPGDTVKVDIFEKATHVDVSGVTKGRGFQGVMHRHGMRGGPITHGGHSKRRIGSIGCREKPGRVHKGKRMPGHMGVVRITQQNLQVLQVRPAENLLVVRGAVPGFAGGIVIVRRALKKQG